MNLPAYLADEASRRMRADLPTSTLRRLLALLDLDLAEAGPEPDFDDLARRMTIDTPENERRGSVVFSGELALLGQRIPICFRYSYVCEAGSYPDAFDEFGILGSVAQLDVLAWPTDARSPQWTKVDFGILTRPMIDALDELVLKQESKP